MFVLTILGDICPLQNNHPFNLTIEGDFIVGNLECALTNCPVPIKKAGPVLFAPTSFTADLKSAGISALSLANNHIRDCGDKGIQSTIEACLQNGIKVFGAAGSKEEAAKPLIVEENGRKVAIISFAEREFNGIREGSSGANVFDPYDSFDIISNVKKTVDAVIVLYHGGIEHYIYPSPLLKKKCRKMVRSGADVVLCQHSHCIGTRETYLDGEILYGQGNSVFGFRKGNDAWNHGLVARIHISESKVKVSYEVLEAKEDGTVSYAQEDVSNKILSKFESESIHVADDSFLDKEWRTFCRKQKSSYLPMIFGLGSNFNRLNRVMKNGFVDAFYSQRQKNVTHNIIRCDAHREVLETILEEYDF